MIGKGQYKAALAEVEERLEESGESSGIHLLHGFLCHQLKQWSQAKRAYGKAMELGSKGEAWLGLSALSLARNQYHEALKGAAMALVHKQETETAYQIGGRALLNLHRPMAAARWFRRACQLNPNSSGNQKDLARALIVAGESKRALVVIGEAWQQFGPLVVLVRCKARACMALGRYGESADMLELLHRTGEATVGERDTLADLRLALGDADGALALYDLMERVGPVGPDRVHRRALALWHAGRLDEAESALAKSQGRLDGKGLLDLANLRFAMGKWERALQTFGLAGKRLPGSPQPLLGKAKIHMAKKEWTEAERAYRILIARKVMEVQSRLGLARIYENRNKIGASMEQLRRARVSAPGNEMVLGEILRLERKALQDSK